ncbi:hypothetical protein LBMAG56_32410 [Verrucomicrobiota bacterium]|nr:hypothetical protein LBMAG56_32410 [Verrucomicrobiota bacterium]
MSHYADSSFLVSCYVTDAPTAQAKAHLSAHSVPLIFTALHDLEVRNALKLGVFRGLFTAAAAAAAWANLERDLQRGRLLRTAVKWPLGFRVASQLSDQHSALTGTRSLDVLHVALARSLRVADFCSFDLR